MLLSQLFLLSLLVQYHDTHQKIVSLSTLQSLLHIIQALINYLPNLIPEFNNNSLIKMITQLLLHPDYSYFFFINILSDKHLHQIRR